MRKLLLSSLLILVCLKGMAQGNRITGTVIDEVSQEPLVGANVVIEELYIGGATDLTGHFEIIGVPDGAFTLLVKYIGYEDRTMSFTSLPTGPVQVGMRATTIMGEEAVVTAMARGQMGAINQQINALQIKNVVSAARIEELPDATAAEAIGRLPGISINRSGGEANKVSVRGLAPKYNNVMVEGVTLLSTDADNRSTDISMIAPNVLAGIDVTKALSADMMANSLGGTVNMSLKEAREGFHMDLSAQGGYNSNISAVNDYKVSLALSNRFLDNKLGVFFGAYGENRYRGKDVLDANWTEDWTQPKEIIDRSMVLDMVNYKDVDEQRKRFGGSLVIDYRLPFGKIKLVNFGSRMNRDILEHSRSMGGENSNTMNYHIYRSGDNFQTQMVNKLGGEFNVLGGKLEMGVSHAMAEIDNPAALNLGAWGDYDLNQVNIDKDSIFQSSDFAFRELINYIHPFGSDDFYGMKSDAAAEPKFIDVYGIDREYTANIDYTLPFQLADFATGFLKGGYMYKKKIRTYDYNEQRINVANGQYGLDVAIRDVGFPDIYETVPSIQGSIDIRESWDDHFDLNNYFDGKYNLYKFMNLDHMEEYAQYCWDFYETRGYATNQAVSTYEKDQDGAEWNHSAYLMAELSMLNGKLSLIPGIRYESVDYLYTAMHIIQPRGAVLDLSTYVDTVESPRISHRNFFPSVHLIAKPTDWMNVRLAYTQTVSRPNFTAIIPRLSYNPNNDPVTVVAGNPNLEPELSTNYDAYISFYQNRMGLFTAGIYYKQIENLITNNTYRILDSAACERIDADYQYMGSAYTVSRNNEWEAKLFGMEFDFQTNFHYLPKPLNGLILNTNFSFNRSETQYYGYVLKDTIVLDPNTGRYRPGKISSDTSYTAPILGMNRYVFNISLGYEIRGFSAHVSFLYQAPTQNDWNKKHYLSRFSDAYTRVDIKARYKFSRPEGLEVFLNVNNVTRTGDVVYYNITGAGTGYTDMEEYYGMNLHLGLRYRL